MQQSHLGSLVEAVPVGIVGDDFKDGYDVFSRFSKNIHNIKIEKGATFRWGGKYIESGDDEILFLQNLVFLKILNQLLMKKMLMFLGSF